jgi:hypothetical protein
MNLHYIYNRTDIDHSISVLLHYMKMSGVSAEIVQADSLLQARSQRHNLQKPIF